MQKLDKEFRRYFELYNNFLTDLICAESEQQMFNILKGFMLDFFNPDLVLTYSKNIVGNSFDLKSCLLNKQEIIGDFKIIEELKFLKNNDFDVREFEQLKDLHFDDQEIILEKTIKIDDFGYTLFLPITLDKNLYHFSLVSFYRKNKKIKKFDLELLLGFAKIINATIEKNNFLEEQKSIARGLKSYERLISMGRIAAGVAHEINNPLTIIQFDLEDLRLMRLQDPLYSEDEKFLFGSISEEIRRMSSIISQLKDYMRPAAENLDLIPLDSLFTSHPFKICVKNIEKQGIKVRVDSNCKGRNIDMSLSNLIQIAINLLTNAEDALENIENPEIEVKSCYNKERKNCELWVIDNGCGIDDNLKNLIFEPFYTSKVTKGTGLGLAICHSLVQKNGGNIELVTENKKKTAFKVSFPCIFE